MSQSTEAIPPSVWQRLPEQGGQDSSPQTPEALLTNEPPDARLADLWSELKSLRQQLEASHVQEARLLAELDATEKALEYTKGEVANLWRAMTTRNLRHAARRAVAEAKQDFRLVRFSDERSRIQGKIADVRALARRRRWPWSLVG